MKKIDNILIIGGDNRQEYMADYFENIGKAVSVYGIPETEKRENIRNLSSAIKEADAIILPLPFSKDGKKIFSITPFKETVDDIASETKSDQLIFAGMLSGSAKNKLSKNESKVFDYFRRDEVSILNSIPTVQGILKTIFDNINYTIHSSKCAVFGYGKTGKLTASTLKALGADVTVCVRKYSDIALAHTNGLEGCMIKDLYGYAHSFDIIINTVPSVVINKAILHELKRECIIIDVASAPYGTDFAAAEKLGIKALQCPSLPGKTAPKTAGEIIAVGILNILKEEGYE